MAQVIANRMTADVDGDLVVFLIGMRINKPWKIHKWLPVFLAMPKMIKELEQRPESGFLGHILSSGRRDLPLRGPAGGGRRSGYWPGDRGPRRIGRVAFWGSPGATPAGLGQTARLGWRRRATAYVATRGARPAHRTGSAREGGGRTHGRITRSGRLLRAARPGHR